MMILFYTFIAMAGLSALGILFIRNVFHAALLLLVCLLAVAGLYIFTYAEFVAVTQILIYAGGVLVVIVFGIMLTTRLLGKPLVVMNNKWFAGLLVGITLLVLLVNFYQQENFNPETTMTSSGKWTSINVIGIEFMTSYMLPFEVAGILLLITLVGAAVTASFKNYKS